MHCEFPQPPPFHSHRLVRGGHLQTIVPFFLRPVAGPIGTQQHQVRLPDGDIIVLHVDTPPRWQPADRSVLLVHGLGGRFDSGYMVRLAKKLTACEFRVWRMDMRGCGAGMHLATGVFHAGRYEDLLEASRFIARHSPDSPLTVVGFSLGANLTLKALGATCSEIPHQLDSAIAVSPPIDLGYCCQKLSAGWGRIYDRYFARQLWREFLQRRNRIRDAERVLIRRQPATLLEFDQHITAPLAGFETVGDYYRSASSRKDLRNIRVPIAILTAADDPIVPAVIYEGETYSPTIQLYVAESGGHLGYLGTGSPSTNGEENDSRWMDWRVMEWIRFLDGQT